MCALSRIDEQHLMPVCNIVFSALRVYSVSGGNIWVFAGVFALSLVPFGTNFVSTTAQGMRITEQNDMNPLWCSTHSA